VAASAGTLLLNLRGAYAIDDAAEVALEDYVRVLLKAAAAHGVREEAATARIVAVRVEGLALGPTPGQLEDVEAFARSLVPPEGGGGLGWS
jgi:hypothetical protein